MRRLALAFGAICCASVASAQQPMGVGYNTYGFPGLIDMPTAGVPEDGDLAFTTSWFQNNLRNTLTFQITRRLSGSFRYSIIDGFKANQAAPGPGSELFDRSFTLHYQLLDETARRPAMAVGINDFLGTGVYGGEYVVMSKTLGPRFRFTGGMGWGRYAGVGSFKNPLSVFSDRFNTRPRGFTGPGGQVEFNELFRGPAALFGGVEYQATDRLRFTLEYSSDAYPFESPSNFDRRSPVNVGVSYKWRPGTTIEAHYLYGSELGIQLTFTLNPKYPPRGDGADTAPPAVVNRATASAEQLGWRPGVDWATSAQEVAGVEARVRAGLEQTGLGLHGLSLTATGARVEVENETYRQQAQAVGRAARVLTAALPPSVETFTIVVIKNGLATTQVTLRRSDIETLEFEFDNSWSVYARAGISSAEGAVMPLSDRYPRYSGGFEPYISPSFFDPDNPVRADFGVQYEARFEPAQGWVVQGIVRKRLFGNLADATRRSDSVLPRVRSDFSLYDAEGDPALMELTVNRFFKPGRDVYGRFSAGYLERMFAGVSGELLWQQSDSDFALGVELNYVQQRDFDTRFGLRDYKIATGHVSAYYDIGNGFFGQVDAGRYLAGDWGATLTLERRFQNGWRVGAFATFTDVSSADFGEGSFDKGILLTIPIDWVSGQPGRDDVNVTIRPTTRDGGARLGVSNRLYEMINDSQGTELKDGWGRFWR